MLNRGFERAFRRLVSAFKRHQDVPRTPHTIAEIGAARWELETARASMAVQRSRYTAPRKSAPFRKIAISDDDLACLQVNAISAGVG